MLIKWTKAFGWQLCGLVTLLAQLMATFLGRRRRVDVLIYKVDRLGDWLISEPAIARIVDATQAKGGTVAVWASQETAILRSWRDPGCAVECFVYDPQGLRAKLRRALSVVRLLAVYQTRTLICLRHAPEPVRDFVLAQADATDVRALSWLIYPGALAQVPYEIGRHHAMLENVGLAPNDIRELLPALSGRSTGASRRVIIAPFSSARIKDWSDEAWGELIAMLGNRGLKFELWVGANQTKRAGELARQMVARGGAPEVSVRSGTLAELGAAVADADLVLSVDTFAAHLAVALDVPTVCLVGGGQFGDFAPWQRSLRQCWVSHPLPCYGCGWQCTRARVECLENISPARILSEIEAVWRADK